MQLYIEYVIIDNCVINYIITKLFDITNGFKIRKINKFLFCLVGTITALFLPYLYTHSILLILYRVIVSIIMTFTLRKYKSIQNFICYYVMLIAYTCLMGGAILLLINWLGIKYSATSIMLYSFKFPLGLFGLILIFLVFVLSKSINVIKAKFNNSNYIHNVVFEDCGSSIEVVGFFDSGNNVTYNGFGVNIISVDLFLKMYPKVDIINILLYKKDKLTYLKNIQYINISSIGQANKYLSFEIDKMLVDGVVYSTPRLAVAIKNFKDFDCVLHKDFVKGQL